MVISAASGEGRTVATACLGWSLATSGRTLLVDADLRNPGLGRLFNLPANPGLVNVVLDQVNIAEAVRPTAVDSLQILPCGRASAETASLHRSSLFRSDAFAHFVATLRQSWDYVVFDTPPFLAEPDATLMARHLDAAILVLEAGRTGWDTAQLTADRLQGSGGRLAGSILNRRRSFVPHALS
jgi:capsular exopolysaccharide synthesis family protein